MAVSALFFGASCSDQHDGSVHWSYQGEADGPQAWGSLDEKFAMCDEGKAQSPINIDVQNIEIDETLPKLQVSYQTIGLDLVNNGHTIQLNAKNAGGLTLGDDKYSLLQIHFHSPSEHTLNDESADMVAHLVHQNEQNQLAVIGVMLNQGEQANDFIASLWNAMPKAKGEVVTDSQAKINVADLLPELMDYYTYPGSLTTPPCSEGVRWLVLKQPTEISSAQLSSYQSLYANSVRPVQPVNDRSIKFNSSL